MGVLNHKHFGPISPNVDTLLGHAVIAKLWPPSAFNGMQKSENSKLQHLGLNEVQFMPYGAPIPNFQEIIFFIKIQILPKCISEILLELLLRKI